MEERRRCQRGQQKKLPAACPILDEDTASII